MASSAARSAAFLARLPAGIRRGKDLNRAANGLPLGLPELDELLPDGGLPRGGVVELAAAGSSLGTSIALSACRAAQAEGRACGGEAPWCAFIDPSSTLYAPGVVRTGVTLERLLVARPPLEALGRVALRLVESQAFAVTVIDTIGTPGASLGVELGVWPRIVRRLSMAVDGSAAVVLLLTDVAARRPLPLPVAMRIELARPSAEKLVLRVAKDKQGRVSSPRSIVWARSGAEPVSRSVPLRAKVAP